MFTFTRDDFLDALDLDAFAEIIRPLGFVKFPVGEDVYLQRGGGGRETALRIPRHRDDEGRWRQAVLHAARTYEEYTGWMLFWIPQTDNEAHYASVSSACSSTFDPTRAADGTVAMSSIGSRSTSPS